MKNPQRFEQILNDFLRGAFVTLVLLAAGAFLGIAHATTFTVSVILDTNVPQQEAEEILTQVSSIYSKQIGVDSRVTYYTTNHVSDDTQPLYLLDKLSKVRVADSYLYETTITLFFTGRVLHIGETQYAGYAWHGLCSYSSVAVIHLEDDLAVDVGNTAHEIGHLFDAPHDGEESCATTPATGYIMEAIGDGPTQFSQCSIGVIKSAIASASCLNPPSMCSAACLPPPVKKSGGGSFDGTFLLVLLVFALAWWIEKRRK